LFVVPTGCLSAVGVAAVGFRQHVRVQAALSEFWAFLAWVMLLSTVFSFVTQAVTTIAAVGLWILLS
jgi:hypothetical protein